MANNSNRRAIEFLVYGALPPHSTNVLWMDSSTPSLPVLKIFWNGAWVPCHTDDSREIALLVDAVSDLTDTNKAQEETITSLTGIITEKIEDLVTKAYATAIGNDVKDYVRDVAGDCIVPDVEVESLPFSILGFSALEDDLDIYTGDFSPAIDDGIISNWHVGTIVKVTGENSLLEPYAGFQEGTQMCIASRVSSVPAGYEQGLYSSMVQEEPTYGVLDTINWQKDHYYRITGFHDLYDMTNNEIIEGFVITYEEVTTGDTITNLVKKIAAKIVEEIVSSFPTDYAKQGSNTNASLSTIQTAIIDGNDTAISTAKEIRSEVGTGSDTASENGTLFAVVKWAKDKIKAIYNAITDGTNGLSAIKQAILDNAGIPTMTIPDSTAAQELAPNVLYVFSTRTSALTLTLGTPITGIANEYHFFLVAGSTAPAVAFPAGITWNGGVAPTIAANKTYEVSILNNIAAFIEV